MDKQNKTTWFGRTLCKVNIHKYKHLKDDPNTPMDCVVSNDVYIVDGPNRYPATTCIVATIEQCVRCMDIIDGIRMYELYEGRKVYVGKKGE